MTSLTTSGLLFDPLDVLFFRDGRPFEAASRVTSGLPQPQTLAGALRTALLASSGFRFADFQRRRREPGASAATLLFDLRDAGAQPADIATRFRGPWLALVDADLTVTPLLPVPQNLTRPEQPRAPTTAWSATYPSERVPPGWQPPLPSLRPLWRSHAESRDDEKPDGFLTLRGISQYLSAAARRSERLYLDEEWLASEAVYGADHRVGVAINADSLTTAVGMLYGISLLALPSRVPARLLRGPSPPAQYVGSRVALYAEAIGPEEVAGRLDGLPISFGGEGKYVIGRSVAPVAWPSETSGGANSIWYLATPGLFQLTSATGMSKPAWVPDRLPGALVGAACGAGTAVSGWDIARGGPKPTRFAVPAGAVYFADGASPGAPDSLCSDPEDVAQGWGFALSGTCS